MHHKWQSYDAWFLRHGARQTEYFVFLDCFLHFYPSNKLKNQTFEKMKTISEDIIILHMPTINENHMMLTLWPFFYGWSSTASRLKSLWGGSLLFTTIGARQTEYFDFLDSFLHLYPLTTCKINVLKKWKQCLEILSFYTSYDVWFLRYGAQHSIFISDCFLPLYPPNHPENRNMKNTPGDIIMLHQCTKNYDHMLHCFWDKTHDRCNPFTTLTIQKIKILKKWKMPRDIILHMCIINDNHMMYDSWNMEHDRWTDGQMDRRTDRPTHIQTDRQMSRKMKKVT